MLSKDILNSKNKYKEKTIIKNKMETENKFNEIYENIIEIDLKEKKRKRRNSLKEIKIFNKKNKENKEKKISIKKKKTKNIEEDINNRFKLISQLKKNEQKNNQNISSLSIQIEEKSENSNSLSKNSNNLSFKSYKAKTPRNFVLKSEIFKLNKMNNSDNKTICSYSKDINKLRTFSEKIKNKEQSNKFFCYLFDKNNDSDKIVSNTYEDIDENEEIKNIFNQNQFFGMNNINDNNLFTNCYINNPKKEDNSEEKFSMKNIYQNSINFDIIKKKLNDDISENINVFLNNNFPSNHQNINSQMKEKQKDINNKTDKENFLEPNMNKQNNINNYYNLCYPNINNNFINNSFFFQNQAQNNINFPGYYYPLNTSVSPFNYQNNLNLSQFFNNNNYNSFNYNNMGMHSNILNTNNLNQNNINKINYNINRNNIMDYKSLTSNKIISLIKTQSGFQLLKEKSLNDHKFANEIFFPKIKYNLKNICTDFFGNSLIQILLDVLTYDNIDAFISYIEESLYDICLTEPGSRVIQKLIEKINSQPLLLNKFAFQLNNKNLGLLFESSYGNYIIQKYLSIVKKKEFTNFLYNYIYNNFISLIRKKHGVCVLQKSILEADEEQRKKLLDLVLINLEVIMKNCYGNFLIQYIFNNSDCFKFEDILPIINKIEDNIVDYCKCKFSASVIEKCFERGDPEISGHIIKYLFDNHFDSIIDILINPFGFFVIKKSLKIQDENYKRKIIQFIWSNRDKLFQTNYGNKIISIISSEYKKYL